MSPSREGLDLLFLGSGNAFSGERYWSSFLVNGRYLFDCSPIVMPHLKRCGIPLEDIEAIFISHFHGDHYFGLPFLFLEYAERVRRSKDLTIVGPPGVMDRTMKITEAAFTNVFRKKDRGYALAFQEAGDGLSESIGDMRFTAREVKHVGDFPCFGYRAEIDGKTVAYSGDTRLCDALVDLGRGADVFVLECSCWGDDCGPHITLDGIRELRERLGPQPAFVLTHLEGGEPPVAVENTFIASDFGTLSF